MPGGRPLTPSKLAAIALLVGLLFWLGFQATRPRLPVAVQFRSTLGSTGFVLIFKNQSDRTLSVTATLAHPGEKHEKKFVIRLQPRSTYELGSPQGWVGESGDRISLTSSNYKDWSGAIP